MEGTWGSDQDELGPVDKPLEDARGLEKLRRRGVGKGRNFSFPTFGPVARNSRTFDELIPVHQRLGGGHLRPGLSEPRQARSWHCSSGGWANRLECVSRAEATPICRSLRASTRAGTASAAAGPIAIIVASQAGASALPRRRSAAQHSRRGAHAHGHRMAGGGC